MIGLAGTVDEFWSELEADFTRFYGEDLRQVCWGPSLWGCRRILSHVVNLPPDSATTRRQFKAPMGWDNSVEMTATLVDSVRHLTDLFVMANSDQQHDPLPRVPRPYEANEPVKPSTISLSQFNSMMED